jgi:hypothetical protein
MESQNQIMSANLWSTNLRTPPDFNFIGLRMAEKFQFLFVTDALPTDKNSRKP